MVRFVNPEFFLLLLLLPVLTLWYFKQSRNKKATLRYSNIGTVKSVNKSPMVRYRHVLFLLRMAVLVLLIVAFARPQSGRTEQKVITEGIDIILAMDISSSMKAMDFKPKNRLEAAKVVAGDFVKGRANDRIGLVVFAAKSFTQCPLTLDYGVLLTFLNQIDIGLIEDGTAIGMAIANCVNRLRDSKSKSKVVILLTDGRNNRGELDPISAAQVAKAMGVRIYTIGAGKHGEAPYPVEDPIFGLRYVNVPVQIDEDLLKEIARITGGRYFRATDRTSLEQIYAEIGELEKTKIEVKEYTRYKELFIPYLSLALGLMMLEIVLANTRFRKLP